MEKSDQSGAQTFWDKLRSVFEIVGDICCSIGHFFKIVWELIVRLRKIFMAAPVIIVALRLAKLCNEQLQGAFRFYILDVVASFQEADLVVRQVEMAKEMAIICPLAVTGTCLVLMFLSRRTVYPWLISVFSLVLPIFVLVAGFLPA